MAEPRVTTDYPFLIQAIDFLRELKVVLLSRPHNQTFARRTVNINCFRDHVLEANSRITAPLSDRNLCLAMGPVTEFIRTVIDDPQPENWVCIQVGEILNELIEDGTLAVPPTNDIFNE